MQNPDIAVVILNWNGKHFLEQFLPQVIAYSEPYRVVLADNASTDDSVSWTKEHFPNLEIVINDSNGGFAKGYNDALKKVKADYYVLLNSDVEVSENWLNPLVETMKNPEIAGCQPKIRSFKNRNTFEHAGASGGFLDKYHYPFCRGRIMDHVEIDEGQYDYPAKIFWATGACLMIRSEIYWEAGGLDERFFAHMEEIDLCWRIHRMGLHFEVNPLSVVYHVGGGTLNYMNPKKTFLNFRNSLLMIHKNQRAGLTYVLFRRLCFDGLAGLVFLFRGQFPHFWAVFRAHISFYNHLPSSIKERRAWKKRDLKTPIRFYKGSILWALYIQKVFKFKDLNQRKMDL
ncbi:glycosyltransferase family 2 protein [Fluviicola taffensis]|uniref:Glycosyl transferase family 2 n=1 Tax=Fluviicola taffensis (strain DSM 16823 / NCIMB 13979 / RW262) TaxID=755732 RepID=F2IH85_FLUTR|nr:glycosyltransferase family 2 protein [Fluviicola taffensis]AEA42640.1 glycosyl transferase family 2 [Fluviicola taffensis DSM 16823]